MSEFVADPRQAVAIDRSVLDVFAPARVQQEAVARLDLVCDVSEIADVDEVVRLNIVDMGHPGAAAELVERHGVDRRRRDVEVNLSIDVRAGVRVYGPVRCVPTVLRLGVGGHDADAAHAGFQGERKVDDLHVRIGSRQAIPGKNI